MARPSSAGTQRSVQTSAPPGVSARGERREGEQRPRTVKDGNPGCGSVPEQNHLGERERVGVGDRDERIPDLELFCAAQCAAVQLKLRRPAAADDLDIAPQDPLGASRSERLHRCFFDRKAAGQVRHGSAAPRTISNFPLGEDALKEALTVALEHVRHARDVCCVETDRENVHDPAPA